MFVKNQCAMRNVIAFFSLLYAGVFVLMIIVHPGTEQFYKDFHNTYQILPPLFAAACNIVYARTTYLNSTNRMGWLLIGLGALSFALGQSTWTVYESVLRLPELPSPGPADIGYLMTYPLLIIGVVLLFGSMPGAGRARLLVDSALVTSSVAVLSWYFLVARLWNNPDVALLGKIISVAYPLGDVAVLLCAIVLLKARTTAHHLRRSLVFLAGGIVLLAFADTAFTYYNLNTAYETGSWFDWGWSFGWLLIAYAALLPLWWPQPQRPPSMEHPMYCQTRRVLTLPRLLAPYVAVGLSFAVVVMYDQGSDSMIHFHVLLLGSALLFLVILRQVLTLLENQQLTGELRVLNANLEKSVVRRTEQVTALLHLTKAVNNTLQEDLVITAALENTREAFQADAVAIRLVADGAPEAGRLPPIGRHIGLDGCPHLVRFIEQLPIRDQAEIVPLPVDPQAKQGIAGSYLRAPLRWQQRTTGMIGVVRWHVPFTPTDQEMLESIGVEVGTALENAHRYAAAVQAADCDPLTGLYNHRAIHQRLDEAFVHARQHHLPLTVIMMDLNNFKRFNDTYGHPIGDQVLKRVAHVLAAQCRHGDMLGRYGGDEFIAVLPGTDASTAFEVAERFWEGMAREGFRRTGDQRTIPVTLSFGLATFPVDSDDRHDLLAIADANLYTAKQSEEGIRGTSTNQRTNYELRTEGTFGVLDALVTAVDNKDRYTRRHSEDVTDYALWIGEALGLSEETLRVIRIGCLLHDVGKIGVPDNILRKPGRLTPDEYHVMQQHARLGAFIVGALPGMESILDIVRSHHERWDGGGYPDGLQGENIPLLGRLVAVADAFSAMTTDRPYRQGLDWQTALEEIEAHGGTQFDPVIAQHFVRVANKRMHGLSNHPSPVDIRTPDHHGNRAASVEQVDHRSPRPTNEMPPTAACSQ